MTDPIAICNCIQCPILTQYQTTQMISLDYASTFELGPFSANTKQHRNKDKTRQDKTGQDKTRQDKTGQDKTRQYKSRQLFSD